MTLKEHWLGTVLSRDSSPVARISSLNNQLVSSSETGVTIWNTSDRSVTRILTSDSVDQVRYLSTNTIVTISRTGNLSYWNTNGELRRSVSISSHGSHTSMLVRNSNEVIIGTKTGKIVYYNSEGVVNRVEETSVEIVNMTLLQNNNLVTVDIDKKIKIYRSSDYTIIKTIDRSTESSQIKYITSGFVDSTEYIKYTVNSKLVVLNYNTEAVFKSIESHETIQAIQYVNNKIVSVAVSQVLYYYELSSGYMVERVSINRDILTLDSNTTHMFVGTKTGEISILQWVNKFVTTFTTIESTSETVIGTNTGRIAILNSKNIITKTIETNVQIKSMTFLSNFNLVSVDTAKKIKIWKSNTYDLVKTIDRSADTGDITLISTAIVSDQEYIVYTIANKLYVLNFNSDTILRQITLQTNENIVSFKYIVDRLSTVAVTRTLYFYYLDDGSLVGSNTVTSDVVRIIGGSINSVRVETTTGIQTVDVRLNTKRLFASESLNRTKLVAKLDPVVVRGGIVVPVPTSKILLIENKNILYERMVFDEPMVALKLLNETTLVAVSDQARMALIDIRSGLKIKEIHLGTKINGAIEAVIQISVDTVLLKIKSKLLSSFFFVVYLLQSNHSKFDF
ncbi:hypothetical protein BpHYR1_006187 [Brachionus plicatilis]|uniref:Uncharacterized protein n=1 Tax=Brachionus plicatilis TaxID=10195 RepID=A0A3M7SWB9_BRAPC|nr:hypothetical protein BpHYR1_006187 [Brachionus plicatilis]